MRALLWLHRWTGGIVGILLAIIGLSGTVLLWEDAWIMLPGADEPVMNDPAALGIVIERALEAGPDLSRITFAGSVAKIVKLEHAWRRLDGRNDDGFQVAPFPG